MAVDPYTPLELIRRAHERLADAAPIGRERLDRGLTLAEKVLVGHLVDPRSQELERGRSYADLRPDRVAMQDATAQMALLQFMTAGLDEVAVPATVHCDHLIQARLEAKSDLASAVSENEEVYEFLRTVSARYGLGFWRPGSGIIHQVVLEQYAFPGGMMIGTDSHTPNAGGLGMIAIGVGGADAVDVMTGFPFNVRWPRLIGVRLTGSLQGWTAPKDVILKVAEILTVKGGTGAVVEYFGPGTESISATGKATICNMGAEIGATTSIFPFDASMARYLRATGRPDVAELCEANVELLRADTAVEAEPGQYFDEVIEIDLTQLPPYINGPHSPDRARPVSGLGEEARREGWPLEISAALVGSCTNSSYEDITRAASLARVAADAGLEVRSPLMITPGSEKVRATIERDGLLADLESIGATVLANACGPCIGQWQRSDVSEGQANSIVTSYNRNFPKRNDGFASTLAFVTSPETVVALALAGTLDFDPASDPLETSSGEKVFLDAPSGLELPPQGFAAEVEGFVAPPEPGSGIEVSVSPDSERLQLLEPFEPWDGNDLIDLPVLVKAAGKCTTDHISAAGPWLRFRGHLENISGNLFLGAVNAFTGDTGQGKDVIDGETRPYPEIARRYHEAKIPWIAIGDENYGEGSSREHAAMEPRFRGCRAVLARSFARIAEANLKKQGVLALRFSDPTTYDQIGVDDRISVLGLSDLAPDNPVSCTITRPDGSQMSFEAIHTLSEDQIQWFRAGSALNIIRSRSGSLTEGE